MEVASTSVWRYDVGIGVMLRHIYLLTGNFRMDAKSKAAPPSGPSLGPGSTNRVAIHRPADTPPRLVLAPRLAGLFGCSDLNPVGRSGEFPA